MRGFKFIVAGGAALALSAGAWAQTTNTAPVQTRQPPAVQQKQAAPAAAGAAAGVQAPSAAPGAQASADAPAARPQAQRVIDPQNALERALMAATDVGAGEAQRNAFRRAFVDSQVVLAVVSAAPNAPPALIEVRPGVRVCVIFTSAARAAQVMGEDAPRVVLTGRQALERVRGANVVLNINLRPYLTLDAEGIEGFLALPSAAPAAGAAPAGGAAPAAQPPEPAAHSGSATPPADAPAAATTPPAAQPPATARPAAPAPSARPAQ